MTVTITKISTTEKLQFRLFQMPCCGHLLCWVNPRLPTHCPECGDHILVRLKSGAHTLDESVAWLKIDRNAR